MARFHAPTAWLTLLGVTAVIASAVALGRSPAEPVVNLSSPATFYAFRLRPGQDLRKELLAFARRENLRAAAVVTCVGSLTNVAVRLPNREAATTRTGHFEIISLVGTLDPAGGHLHLCVTDSDGVAFGGHLLDGCLVYTTSEIVISELTSIEFRREPDKTFGYNELVVSPRMGKR